MIANSLWIASASAETYSTFDQVPYVYASDPSRFNSLFKQAQTGTVRLALLGDSQETSPGGAGAVYVPQLGQEFWKVYGNVPETQVGGANSYGFGNPHAEFLLSGSTANSYSSSFAANQVPPGLSPGAFYDRSKNTYPMLTHLEFDATDTAAPLPANAYFKTGSAVQAQILYANGAVHWEAAPTATGPNNFFATVTAKGDTPVAASIVQKATVTIPTSSANPYMQVILSGTSSATPTDILGVRFASTVDSRGVAVEDLAAGGYTTSSYLANHGASGPAFALMGFHAAVLHYGANDAANGETPEQFKSDQLALISAIRGWVGDPNFPIILAGDPYGSRLTHDQQLLFDQYPGAQMSIAEADPNVEVLNGRRLTEDLGWSSTGDYSLYISENDGVHYTTYGAQVLAAAEVEALTSAVPEPTAAMLLLTMTAMGAFMLRPHRTKLLVPCES